MFFSKMPRTLQGDFKGRYLVYVSRAFRMSEYPGYHCLEFEMIEKQSMNMFLESNSKEVPQIQLEKHQNVIQTFRTHGIDSPEFQSIKMNYLGDVSLYYLTVGFPTLTLYYFAINHWYLVDIYEGEGGQYPCYIELPSAYEDGVASNLTCNLFALPEEQHTLLRKLFMLKPSQLEHPNTQLNAIQNITQFQRVDLYYVGAALCAGLIDNANNVVGYFDMGCICGNVNLQLRTTCQNNRTNLLQEFTVNNPNKTVIISHWHRDHINLARAPAANAAAFANFYAQSEWYVPQDAAPAVAFFAARIPGPQFHVIPSAYPGPPSALQNINANPNISYGKIDTYANLHPHHHGIYSIVTLTSGHRALLAGDCTYAGIPPAVRGAPNYSLQACHHGGDCALPPAPPPAGYIPTVDPLSLREVVYSANGITYGHPNAGYVQHHTNAGWTNPKRMHRLAQGAAPQDHYSLT